MLVTDPRPQLSGPEGELEARLAADGIIAAELRMLAAAIDQAGCAIVTGRRSSGEGDTATIANALAGYGMQLRQLAGKLEPTPGTPGRE